jgi:ATP synthase protein I
MTEGDSQKPKNFADRLRALRDQVKPAGGDGGGRGAPQTAVGWVFRLSIELAAGLLVGGVIGWLLDRWLGTRPWLMILFFLLGAAAGMVNVIRAAQEINRPKND